MTTKETKVKIPSKEKSETGSAAMLTAREKRNRKGKINQGGFLWRISAPYREWRALPQQINVFPAKSQKNLDMLCDMLLDYRLVLMKATHVAKNVNQRIWGTYQQINKTSEALTIETSKKALFLRSLITLRKLQADWEELMTMQVELQDSISRAPVSVKFYNMMMTYKEIRQQEKIDDEYNERRFSEAYNSLELALDYVDEYINKRENAFFSTSKLLKLDDARQWWSDKLKEITELQKSGRMNIEGVLAKMELLKNIVFEAPPMAKWINDVEQRYFRLINDHELLNNMYQKSIIRAEELEETSVIMNDMVPRFWINGENIQLDRYLKQIETFVNTYELSLQEELAYQERHRPWSSSDENAKEADELDMLTSFVGIIINAVEARESHMGDHSATVARLAQGTAEELQWSSQEIKYLHAAGLLHDVGKIWIPESLLSKPGPLTENEMQVLRMHPFYSSKIVESIKVFKDIVPWVYYHHERWDGNGYPENLRQNEIPLGASIIAVAEAFSAMIFNRLYREPLTIDQAFEQIREGAGKQFDPDVIEQFITAASKMRVELEEGQKKGFTSQI